MKNTYIFAAHDDIAIYGIGETSEHALQDAAGYVDDITELKTSRIEYPYAMKIKNNGYNNEAWRFNNTGIIVKWDD